MEEAVKMLVLDNELSLMCVKTLFKNVAKVNKKAGFAVFLGGCTAVGLYYIYKKVEKLEKRLLEFDENVPKMDENDEKCTKTCTDDEEFLD